MLSGPETNGLLRFRLSRRNQFLLIGAAAATVGVVALLLSGVHIFQRSNGPVATPPKRAVSTFQTTPDQWKTLGFVTVEARQFHSEHITEGKIAVDEDHSTLVFSPYAGRVTRLLHKPGDKVERGEPLFVLEATDMVQAQNDFMTAVAANNKALSQLNLAQTVERRQRELFESKAVALKDWQQAQAELVVAQNDVRSSEVALDAARNRLYILGRTDQEIAAFRDRSAFSPETSIKAPISGTIVQRKVGPGQYVTAGSSDPVFVIGDLSSVWLIAYVRESEAPRIRVGQKIGYTILAYPNDLRYSTVAYVGTALDPVTHRLTVRAVIDNQDGHLKPEMFANVRLYTGEETLSPAVPRNAVIFEGEAARVWVAHDDQSIELRNLKLGVINDDYLQVLDGLQAGEKVVTKGGLFIDRIAAGS